MDEVPENDELAIMCSSGIRGSLASSILLGHGRTKVTNVLGGMKALERLKDDVLIEDGPVDR